MDWWLFGSWTFLLFIPVAIAVAALLESLWRAWSYKPIVWAGLHVLITGGSTGLGLAFAMRVAREGARVTIISRSRSKLDEAFESLAALSARENILALSADVTDSLSISNAIEQAQSKFGPVDVLVANAGLAVAEYFTKASVETFKQQMDLNYMGCVHVTHAALPAMIQDKSNSNNKSLKHIVFVSSACGLVGFAGYSPYVPTKFAVRGLADCLRNELKAHEIGVSIYYPSSMDTPGFANEEIGKPSVTKKIEGQAKLISAGEAAQILFDGINKRNYHITSEFMIECARAGANGMTPRNNYVIEWLLGLILPLVEFIYYRFMDYTVVADARIQRVASYTNSQ